MLRLAVLSARGRFGAFTGALVALFAAAVLSMAWGMQLESILRTHPPVERYAGAAAHLAGAIAANTTLPVIGIPIDSSSLKGLDALLATVQMPAGIPVATMAIGKAGAANAGIFAAQIVARKDADVATKLAQAKKEMAVGVEERNRKLQSERNKS